MLYVILVVICMNQHRMLQKKANRIIRHLEDSEVVKQGHLILKKFLKFIIFLTSNEMNLFPIVVAYNILSQFACNI